MPSSFNCCAIFSAWRPAIIYLLLLLTLGYWLVGPMAIWAAMCLVAYALCRQKDKLNWAMGLVAVLVVGLFVQLARKYLYILHDATFYRQWAEDVLPLTRSVKLLDAHPLYGPLSHSFPEKDVMY